jgi:glutamate racemase
MTKETKAWLDRKLTSYSPNKEKTLEEMLHDTNSVIEQFLKDKGSKAAESVLLSCLKHNRLFLEAIENRSGRSVQLSDREIGAVKALNFVASHDGILTEEQDIKYILSSGMEKFIPKRKRHLLEVREDHYPIRILISKDVG